MTQIYLLLLIATGVLSSVMTLVYITGSKKVKLWYVSWKSNRLRKREKRFKLKWKRLVRNMVREYLSELQNYD
jgi:hypothetical protein